MADLVDDEADSEDDEFINDVPSRPMSPMDDESGSDFDDLAHLPARKQCISSLSPVPILPSDLFGTPPSPSKSPKRKNIRKNANKHNLSSSRCSPHHSTVNEFTLVRTSRVIILRLSQRPPLTRGL